MKRIVFRADGNEYIGLGHLIRCSALAEMLSSEFAICFIAKNSGTYIKEVIGNDAFHLLLIEEDEDELQVLSNLLTVDDILIADGYYFDEAWQRTIKQRVSKFVLIDDLVYTNTPYADIIINHAPGVSLSDYQCPSSVRLLLGADYALLRPAFFNGIKKTTDQKSGIVLTMGGSDPDNLTRKIAQIILNHTDETIDLLLGAAYVHPVNDFMENKRITIRRKLKEEEVAQLFWERKLVISSASTVSLEASAIGTSLIIGLIAD
ncbi:MAG TPA: UDP-2,4-diacetamido-2,4,6-trideoxy-beta-L-altropyranose hydrolase, partial [Cytophagaceae bacterium]|nr:UDP-2,4-diacetamido-2,4,6-trideoxy-beta-L-altropyranose hydrolase [Cytophagaceae bacterium]